MSMPPLAIPASRLFLCALAVALALSSASAQSERRLKVLIIDGQNNHAWAATTPIIERILEQSGRFEVDVSTTPPAKPTPPRMPKSATAEQRANHTGRTKAFATELAAHEAGAPAAWAKWRPKFSDYSVVLSNYNGETWPVEVRAAFEAFVRNGGGFVSYHAANNAFPDWPEYNEMIGIGGWGARTEKSGPYLRLRGNAWTTDPAPGKGGAHGPQSEFLVEVRAPEHPIMRGLPARFMHAKDELYESLRGPARGVQVLASAYSNRTNEHEPMLMTISYGRGRVFHTTLGHALDALKGLGFQVTLQRGTEWAATGTVTLAAPKAGQLSADRASPGVITADLP